MRKAVGRRIEQNTAGVLAVAPGAAGLLVIGLETAGGVEMDDAADVVTVDPHAKGVGGGNDGAIAGHEMLLRLVALVRAQAGVVAEAAETLANGLDGLAGGGVDNRWLRLVEEFGQGFELVFLAAPPDDAEGQVGTLEAGDEMRHVGAAQLLDNVVAHNRRGGGGKAADLGNAELLNELADPRVVRAKVMAPLADAVRLIDHQEVRREIAHGPAELAGAQALGRDVEQLQLAGRKVLEHLSPGRRREGAVDEGGGYALGAERIDLVFHEGDEGGDDQGVAGLEEGGKLVAQRLAGAGGHDNAQLVIVH